MGFCLFYIYVEKSQQENCFWHNKLFFSPVLLSQTSVAQRNIQQVTFDACTKTSSYSFKVDVETVEFSTQLSFLASQCQIRQSDNQFF